MTQWAGPSHTNLFKTILHSCPDSVDSPLPRLHPSEVIPAPVKVTLKLSVTVNLLQKQKLSELKDILGPPCYGGDVKVSPRITCLHIQLPAVDAVLDQGAQQVDVGL